jgi:hypothetical protein
VKTRIPIAKDLEVSVSIFGYVLTFLFLDAGEQTYTAPPERRVAA